jgi:dihydroxyacid dehydratase/phosphogluconate dehydratase
MTAHQLRSRNWFGRSDLDGFVHRSWLKAEGFSDVVFDGRPVVGIANSWSELTNGNTHLRQVADAVKRGVRCVERRRLPARVSDDLAGRSALRFGSKTPPARRTADPLAHLAGGTKNSDSLAK